MTKSDTLAKLFDVLASNILHRSMVDLLADELGVTTESLLELGIGYHPTKGAYAMPERSSDGSIIGISYRTHDGKKFMEEGSKHGLFYKVNPEFTKGDKAYDPGKHNWIRVETAEVTCPICGKPDWCLVSAGNPSDPAAVVCSRLSEGSKREIKESGFLHILKPEGNVRNDAAEILSPTDLPLLVIEGYTDTAAAMDMGFVAVGRPSAKGKLELLLPLCKGKDAIVVGENDTNVQKAGQVGMDSTFLTLKQACNRVIKVLPPARYNDLRRWKNDVSLTEVDFLTWVADNGETASDPNLLESDVAHSIAQVWLQRDKMQDDLPLIRCYHGQWVEFKDGHYKNQEREEFRGQIYHFLDGKKYPRCGPGGEIVIDDYRPTRSKVTDIVDALSDWCTISEEAPVWLKDMGLPKPTNLIAFRNGLLDVEQYINGKIKLYDSTPALFSYNILPYDFDENAESPIWNEFLEDIFNHDKDRITLLSQWFGYNCVPDMRYEKLMLFTGRPRSGKGTALNAMMSMLGTDQCVSTSFQALSSEFGFQALIGKLSATMGDVKVPRRKEAGAALEKILQVVGQDPVGVRRMYLTYLSQVYLTCRFTIAMNDLPNLPDQANALEPRLNILAFNNSYVGREKRSLKRNIQREAEQGKLINFALRGLRDLRMNDEFIRPRSGENLKDQLRELTTPLSVFVEDCCTVMPDDGDPKEYYIIIDQLYEAWCKWCEEGGTDPGSKAIFGRSFLAACPSAASTRLTLKGRRYRIYQSVALQDWVKRDDLGESI